MHSSMTKTRQIKIKQDEVKTSDIQKKLKKRRRTAHCKKNVQKETKEELRMKLYSLTLLARIGGD